jgi:hypothetical protein
MESKFNGTLILILLLLIIIFINPTKCNHKLIDYVKYVISIWFILQLLDTEETHEGGVTLNPVTAYNEMQVRKKEKAQQLKDESERLLKEKQSSDAALLKAKQDRISQEKQGLQLRQFKNSVLNLSDHVSHYIIPKFTKAVTSLNAPKKRDFWGFAHDVKFDSNLFNKFDNIANKFEHIKNDKSYTEHVKSLKDIHNHAQQVYDTITNHVEDKEGINKILQAIYAAEKTHNDPELEKLNKQMNDKLLNLANSFKPYITKNIETFKYIL